MKKTVVVIPAYGQVDYLNETIRTLCDNNHESMEGVAEVFVRIIDNGTPPEQHLIAQLKIPPDRPHWHHSILSLQENMGVTSAWNLGLEYGVREIDADYVMIANSDLHFGPHVLTDCMNALDSDDYYAVFPHTYKQGGKLPDDFDAQCVLAHSEKRPIVNTGGFAGWCFVMSRECLTKIGWLDPRFKLWHQDSDYLRRLIAAGHPAMEIRSCLIHHYESRSIKSLPQTFGYKGWIARDRKLLDAKYPKRGAKT